MGEVDASRLVASWVDILLIWGRNVYCFLAVSCISLIFLSLPSLSVFTLCSILSRSLTSFFDLLLIAGLKVASSNSFSSSSCLRFTGGLFLRLYHLILCVSYFLANSSMSNFLPFTSPPMLLNILCCSIIESIFSYCSCNIVLPLFKVLRPIGETEEVINCET